MTHIIREFRVSASVIVLSLLLALIASFTTIAVAEINAAATVGVAEATAGITADATAQEHLAAR